MRVALLLLIILLSGCASTEPVVKTYTFYSEIDPSWIVPCPLEPPPVKEDYLLATTKERTLMMALAYTGQIEKVTLCNIRLEEVRKQNDRAILHNESELERMKE